MEHQRSYTVLPQGEWSLPIEWRGPGAKHAPYSTDDLEIPSYIGLARKLGDGENKGLRRTVRKYTSCSWAMGKRWIEYGWMWAG